MSFRARMRRIAYIDRRLRSKRDYPSMSDLARDYLAESGESFSTKTFQRDLEILRDEYNAPLEYEPSRHGYFYSDETWTMPSFQLNQGELLAVLVADRALASYRNSPYYDQLKTIFLRLTDLLPEKVTVHSQDIATNISIIPEPVTTIDPDVWPVLQRGLFEGKKVVIHYQTPGYSTPAERLIDPYHITGHKGEWYLLGYSHTDKAVRIYSLARIKSCRLSKEKFDHPKDFIPSDFMDPGFGVFMGQEKAKVAIKFYPPLASTIGERYWHPDQTIEALEDGSVILKFTTNQQSQTLFWAAQWGPNAEILEPQELRDEAAEWFADTAGRYQIQ